MFVVRRSLIRVSNPVAALAGCAGLLAAVAGLPVEARAQSFFEQLFGGAPKPVYRPAPMPAAISAPKSYSPASRSGQDDSEPRGSSERRGGSYRTVCVRLCDGAFFPISFTSQRSHMHDDADACRNRCWGTEARLFYHHNSADMKEAVDLAGRSYKSLQTAFLFRKKLVDGCTCKPAPWTEAEADRHRRYAIAEGRVTPAQSPTLGSAVVIAGNYPESRSEPIKTEPHVEAKTATEAEIDGIPVVNVPVAGPPIPQMAQADMSAALPMPDRASQRERSETRYEARREHKSETRQAQAAKPHQQPQQPVWKVVKPTAPGFAAAPTAPRKSSSSPSTATLFGSPGGGKYVWPGDAPTRYR